MARSPAPLVELAHEGATSRVFAVTCHARRRDRPYPELHAGYTVALVRRGRFQYRSEADDTRHDVREGWVILGRPGTTFECAHDHDDGDDCTAMHVTPEMVEDVASQLGGHGVRPFSTAVHGPSTRVASLVARLDVGADVDETLYDVVAATIAGEAPQPIGEERANRRRIERALEKIEAASHEPLSLGDLAKEAGLSQFHFLRLFRAMTGTTPKQYLVGTRLRRAARLLVDTELPVTRIAYDVGFEDVSNFVRTFHREVGAAPGAFRGLGKPR